ncbi:MAG: hypothetical protein K2G29_05995, partial [Muribaculaceae bacterium]|nr:hypothetical protein [Muribaculaceae bacterium]
MTPVRLPAIIILLLLLSFGVKGQKKDVLVGVLDALVESQTGPADLSADGDAATDPDRYNKLTDRDFVKVAKELGVEVAAIKA